MATPAEISAQVDLEREQIRQGLERLRNNTIKLQDKEYASASVYGVSSIEELLPKVIQQIKDTNERIHQRHLGRHLAAIHEYLADIEPEAAAAIALQIFYDDFIDKVDVLMENIMAKQDRPQFSKGSITLVGYSQQAVEEFSQRVKVTLDEKLPLAVPTEGNEEIYNIVEELKALVNKLDYLLTLK